MPKSEPTTTVNQIQMVIWGSEADDEPLRERAHRRELRVRRHVVVGAPVAEDGDQHDQHDGNASGEGVGEERAPERGPGLQAHEEADDRGDDEDPAAWSTLFGSTPERAGGESERREDGEGEDRQAERPADGSRSLAGLGQLPSEPGAEDHDEPRDADEGAPPAGRLAEEQGRPALQLSHEPQQRHGEGDDGRHQDQLAGAHGFFVAHGASSSGHGKREGEYT